jgi:cytochrome P450 family 33
LIKNPEVQQKLHEELDKVIGGDRLVTLTDKSQLPYLNAVIVEIQRVSNILAINLPRRCARDVELNGYLFKKGTIVVPQISVIMSDPKVNIGNIFKFGSFY